LGRVDAKSDELWDQHEAIVRDAVQGVSPEIASVDAAELRKNLLSKIGDAEERANPGASKLAKKWVNQAFSGDRIPVENADDMIRRFNGEVGTKDPKWGNIGQEIRQSAASELRTARDGVVDNVLNQKLANSGLSPEEVQKINFTRDTLKNIDSRWGSLREVRDEIGGKLNKQMFNEPEKVSVLGRAAKGALGGGVAGGVIAPGIGGIPGAAIGAVGGAGEAMLENARSANSALGERLDRALTAVRESGATPAKPESVLSQKGGKPVIQRNLLVPPEKPVPVGTQSSIEPPIPPATPGSPEQPSLFGQASPYPQHAAMQSVQTQLATLQQSIRPLKAILDDPLASQAAKVEAARQMAALPLAELQNATVEPTAKATTPAEKTEAANMKLPPKRPIPTKLHQDATSTDNMNDPDTRFNAARHEAGHAVVSEALSPGSIDDMSLTSRGGTTNLIPPKGKTDVGQLNPDELRNMVAANLAGGLSEEGGTTTKHTSGDLAVRDQIFGKRADSLGQNASRLLMGHTSGTDEMLQSGQTLAEARARVSALLADPKVQKQIDTLAEKLTTKGRLTGDEVRAHLKGKKAGVSVLSGD
jgi:hypothetical protein